MTEYFVYPGQLALSKESARIKTILGSCVSVVFWDKETRIGGLCHYLLPEPMPGSIGTPRYGNFAIPELLRKMLQAGAQREHIKAKVFGGGNVVSHLNRLDGNIGDRNIEVARSELKKLNIAIIEENTGGTQGRWIALDTTNFAVEHRFSAEKEESANLSGTATIKVRERIKVLIVDDSATVRAIFSKILAQSANIEVVGTAVDPYEAREKIIQLKPDVMTLDIEMPKMNGVTFLEKLMAHHPLPVIMVSSLGADGEAAQRCLELGAVEFVQKPSQYDPSLLKDLGDVLINKIIAASTAQVSQKKTTEKPRSRAQSVLQTGLNLKQGLNLIGIGGNVGSADSLAIMLKGLAADSPPVVVAVSTISGFIDTFIQRLQNQCRVELQILKQEETSLSMGRVYFASANNHVLIKKSRGGGLTAILEKSPASFGQRPSSEKLFNSLAESLPGACCAVLLSGFSLDGVNGLLKVRESGGVTLVQNPEEAPFNASPVSAIEKGAADYILNAEDLASCVMQIRNSGVLRAG